MANWRIFPNAAATYLTNASLASDGLIIVATGTGFPDPNPGKDYTVKVDNELMLVTQVSSNLLFVTRGVDGTTAASHSIGALVFHVVSSGDFAASGRQFSPTTVSGAPSAAPANSSVVQFVVDPSANILYLWNGTAWKSSAFT